jgi:radical SAM protein with 4Fe4S-binding SPASM domain
MRPTIARMSRSLAGDSHYAFSCSAQSDAQSGTSPDSHGAPSPNSQRPSQVVWQITQACDLSCTHCRINSHPHRHPLELSTAEAFNLIDQTARMGVPAFILTGGDPLRRPDILPVVQYAARRNVNTSLIQSPTPLLTKRAVLDLKSAGLNSVAFGLDGATAALHDTICGVTGSYKRTFDAVGWCDESGLQVQINTLISRRNFADLAALIELLESLRVVQWNVYFLVPAGLRQINDLLSPAEHEQVFERIYQASRKMKFRVTTTEGQHYRRYVLQQLAGEGRGPGRFGPLPDGANEGKDVVFVSHTGEVHPSEFLPLSAGNILWEPLAEIYQNSPLFLSLRSPSHLKGKCGKCEFNQVCGGSRARAYALTQDPLAEDPSCAYVPQ